MRTSQAAFGRAGVEPAGNRRDQAEWSGPVGEGGTAPAMSRLLPLFHASFSERTAVATVELTKDNFEQTVNENPLVIVDFWAPWCGPCRGFAPVYEKASETHKDVVFAKVNTDEQQALRRVPDPLDPDADGVPRESDPVPAGRRAPRAGARAGDQPTKTIDMAKVHAEVAGQKQGE